MLMPVRLKLCLICSEKCTYSYDFKQPIYAEGGYLVQFIPVFNCSTEVLASSSSVHSILERTVVDVRMLESYEEDY